MLVLRGGGRERLLLREEGGARGADPARSGVLGVPGRLRLRSAAVRAQDRSREPDRSRGLGEADPGRGEAEAGGARPMNPRALFSPCGLFRYRLWRHWTPGMPPLVFVMLNPSTADAEKNDPTVERCERRAKAGGFGGGEVVNLFALRSTDPKALYSAADPIGPENDKVIATAAGRSH